MILTTVFLKRQSPSGEKWCACFVWAIVRTKVSAGIKIHEWFTQHLHHCWTGCDASATESKMITCLWCVSAASPCKIAALQSPVSLSSYFRVTEIVSYLVLGSCDSMRTNVFSGVTWGGEWGEYFGSAWGERSITFSHCQARLFVETYRTYQCSLSLNSTVHTILEFLICCLPER